MHAKGDMVFHGRKFLSRLPTPLDMSDEINGHLGVLNGIPTEWKRRRAIRANAKDQLTSFLFISQKTNLRKLCWPGIKRRSEQIFLEIAYLFSRLRPGNKCAVLDDLENKNRRGKRVNTIYISSKNHNNWLFWQVKTIQLSVHNQSSVNYIPFRCFTFTLRLCFLCVWRWIKIKNENNVAFCCSQILRVFSYGFHIVSPQAIFFRFKKHTTYTHFFLQLPFWLCERKKDVTGRERRRTERKEK